MGDESSAGPRLQSVQELLPIDHRAPTGVIMGRLALGYEQSKEFETERLRRDAPMLLIGEGMAPIQQMFLGQRLLEEHEA